MTKITLMYNRHMFLCSYWQLGASIKGMGVDEGDEALEPWLVEYN